MTPSDVKAIRIIARHLGIDGIGYNPRENDEQANALIDQFGIVVELGKHITYHGHGQDLVWWAYKDGRSLANMSGYECRDGDHRRYVIVHAVAALIAPGWEKTFDCFKEGLDPFKIGHIVDARS